MFTLESPLLAFQGFFGAGGSVLWVIFAATALMWTMIVERLWFFRYVHTKNLEAISKEWSFRRETSSWNALRIRRQLISGISLAVNRYVRIIQALMALLPLLGLLGTVTGMIQIFNVVAVAGTTNARLMAAGVSAATIPNAPGWRCKKRVSCWLLNQSAVNEHEKAATFGERGGDKRNAATGYRFHHVDLFYCDHIIRARDRCGDESKCE